MLKKILSTYNLSLITIIIIASFLRLYNLMPADNKGGFLPPGLYPDEAMNGNNAVESWENRDWKVFYPENFGREGLFINIQSIFIGVIGRIGSGPIGYNITGSMGYLVSHQPWVLRLPSAIFGILTVLGLYFLTKELFMNYESRIKNYDDSKIRDSLFVIHNSEAIALLASFLLATSFWHINFSRIGFRAIMAPFFLVWSLYFLLVSIRKTQFINSTNALKSEIQISKSEINSNDKNPKSKTSFENFHLRFVSDLGFRASCFAILAGLLYGLGFYSYIAYRATPFLILAIYFLAIKTHSNVLKNIRMSFLVFSVVVVFTVLPLGIYFLQHPADFFGRTAGISVFTSETPFRDLGWNILKTAGMFNIAGDSNWRHNVAGRPLLFWPIGILFLIGIIIGLKTIFRNPKREVLNPKQYLKLNVKNFESFKFNNLNLFRDSDFGFLILFAWLIVTALPVVISNEGIPHALRSILMAPPVFILSAVGGMKVYEFLKTKSISRRLLVAGCWLFISLLLFESYFTYFENWGNNPNVKKAFTYDDYLIAQQLNQLPNETPKYLIVREARGTIERDNPISLQSVLFLTDTFSNVKRKERNIIYLTEERVESVKVSEDSFVISL